SEQAPLQSAFETFAGPVAAEPIQVHALSSPPFPRFWFESEDRAYILQLQQDRILFNWRATSSESVYPRYETLRERFMTKVQQLAEFFEGQKFGGLSPNQCEVTYINSISEDAYARLDRITPLWSEKAQRISGLDVERTVIQTVFILKSNEQPCGRLYAYSRLHCGRMVSCDPLFDWK
ncbi:MAG: TIGR04255 family protein, partial [Nitrososphaera sp.]|nr:TIGR04255 family protein [Nitrososphaera sp.]